MKTKKEKKISQYNSEKAFFKASLSSDLIFSDMETGRWGLTDEQVEERRKIYGQNEVAKKKRNQGIVIFIKAFINPFIGILMVLVLVSLLIDVLLVEPGSRDWSTVIIISTMVLLSVILRFIQERRSNKASEALKDMVKNTASVYRNSSENSEEVNITELVPGDIVYLASGDMIPADIRIIEAKDFFVSQSALTGESEAVEKTIELALSKFETDDITELSNICFMGSNVVSGSAIGVVFETGLSTYLGTIAKSISGERAQTSFDQGINKVSLLLIRFMLVMVPLVFLINGITKGDWFSAFVFAVSIAVGLTPEMLPMIVTSNLSKGAVAMSKRKTIVKNLNSIQSFGAMNILCTDKTGTLTRDKIVLERYLNIEGKEDLDVLQYAYFNSFFQTGLKNIIDKAILSHVHDLGFEYLEKDYQKIDEVPFDFVRRRMSVIIKDKEGKKRIITKGAMEEMLDICAFTEQNGKISPISEKLVDQIVWIGDKMNTEGMRVLGVAYKNWEETDHDFSVEDETGMIFMGFLAFLDPPKESAKSAIQQLHSHGVEVKVLSGDNESVVKTICKQVGVDTSYSLLGREIENMTDEELTEQVKKVKIFAKLTPLQKTRIVKCLQEQDNTVGFLGDGINDAPALKQSDIGISVDTAVDIAKESADIILLEKDLMVLEEGVIEGRKIFGNIMKYIKMTASSNFGNIFSVLAASAFLPFLPMMPIHLLIQNLLYDVSQTTIPFDNVDEEYIQKPRKWDTSGLSRFMLIIGPISSVFDIAIFIIMWFVLGWNSIIFQSLFQSGWFVYGLISQTLIVHMIRTRNIPFIQSRASWPLMLATILVIIVGVIFPFTGLGAKVGLTSLPWNYFPWLIIALVGYCLLTQFAKVLYIRRFKQWL